MRTLLAAIASIGAFVGFFVVGGKALGIWDPIVPASAPAPQWTKYKTARFTIELPSSWQRVDTGAGGADALGANRAFAKFVAEARKAKAGFHAFDTSQESRAVATREQFVTNVGVVSSRVSVPAEEVWRRDLKGLAILPHRIGRTKAAHVRIGGRLALMAQTRFRIRSPLGGRPLLSMTQWSVVSEGYEYLLTFVTTKAAETTYAATFGRSAASFALLAKQPQDRSKSKPRLAAFRDQVNEICSEDFPVIVPPLTSLSHARARAGAYARLVQDLKDVQAPSAVRSDYNGMTGALEDLVSEVEHLVSAISGNQGGQEITNDVADATQASARASSYASKLNVVWCADSLAGAA